MKSKRDTRTREEKLRDLATNSGATNAEKKAALFHLRESAIDRRKAANEPLSPPDYHFTSNADWIRQRTALQRRQRGVALKIQRQINAEMRSRFYGPKAAKITKMPLSPSHSPDYSPLFLLALFIILCLYYGC